MKILKFAHFLFKYSDFSDDFRHPDIEALCRLEKQFKFDKIINSKLTMNNTIDQSKSLCGQP